MREVVVVTPLAFEGRVVASRLGPGSVTVCGMGPGRARATGARLDRDAPHAVAIAGFGGGLVPGLQPGQVVVATSVYDRDQRVGIDLPAAPVLRAQLRRAGLDVVCGPIVSAPSVTRGAARAALAARGAIAVDMESAYLLDQLGTLDPEQLAVVRVVVDTPERELLSRGIVAAGLRATRALRAVGPALQSWGNAVGRRRVYLAGPRSFCAGVDRAIGIVHRALDRYGTPVYVRRQIVHNTHVVNGLERAGAIFVQELDEVPDGATVVFAAHGVTPEVRNVAAERDLHVIDATCPLVAKVHAEARHRAQDGYSIVLIGHDDHEEVIGTHGESPDHIQVVAGPDDVIDLTVPDESRVAYLTQTTLAIVETTEVIASLRERFPAIVGPRADDICYATQNRQEAVRRVARLSDLVLVVGSANSSNSNRLVEVAGREGGAARLIEDETDIDLDWLHGVHRVGITAGASAPEEIVQRVVAWPRALGPIDVFDVSVVTEDIRFSLPAGVR
jgi:4-hydroxy-3-methylbut-2-enyl diphosphate reductase